MHRYDESKSVYTVNKNSEIHHDCGGGSNSRVELSWSFRKKIALSILYIIFQIYNLSQDTVFITFGRFS